MIRQRFSRVPPQALVLTLLLAAALPLHLRAQTVEEVRQRLSAVANGKTVEVALAGPGMAGEGDGTALMGELLAADEGTVWLLRQDGLVDSIPLAHVTTVRLERHGFARKAGMWALVGGLATTLGMFIACQSVDDSTCGGVVGVVGGSWAIIGGAAAHSIDGSGWEHLPASGASLRAYARFPQGLPPGFRRRP